MWPTSGLFVFVIGIGNGVLLSIRVPPRKSSVILRTEPRTLRTIVVGHWRDRTAQEFSQIAIIILQNANDRRESCLRNALKRRDFPTRSSGQGKLELG